MRTLLTSCFPNPGPNLIERIKKHWCKKPNSVFHSLRVMSNANRVALDTDSKACKKITFHQIQTQDLSTFFLESVALLFTSPPVTDFLLEITKTQLFLSQREARKCTWFDQRFVSVNIAAPEPARKIVILEDFAC